MFISLAAISTIGLSSTLYVSPKGSDEADGSSGRPFKTLERALEASRNEVHPVRIALVGGDYELSKPLALGPQDSGLTIEAAKGQKPVVYGSQVIKGWKTDDRGWWTTDVAPQFRSGIQLWVNGSRRYRTRLPEKGSFKIAAPVERDPKGPAGFNAFKVSASDMKAWKNMDDADLIAVHMWTVSRNRIASLQNGQVTFRKFTGNSAGYHGFQKDHAYWIENLEEALGVPGRWHLSRSTGRLTYVPRKGEELGKSTVRMAAIPAFVQIQGQAGQEVKNVTLRGITFRHSDWTMPDQGRYYHQADADLPAAISADYARNVRLESLTVEGTGAYAVSFGDSVQNSAVKDCVLSDLGGGGVKIGPVKIEEDPAKKTRWNAVEGCRIIHGGRLHPSSIGVWIGQSASNVVKENLISDFYYTGISVGWTWGYGPSDADHNLVEHNLVSNIGQGLLSDMGGIYCLGNLEGTILRGNIIHDVTARYNGGYGVYLDEGATHVTVEDNIVYRMSTAPFHQHYGKENQIFNNVFAFGRTAQIIRSKPEDHSSFTIERNLMMSDDAPIIGSYWAKPGFTIDHNVYWRRDRKPLSFQGLTFEQWQRKGYDQNTVVGDPLFVDPDHGDFRLQPGSPASIAGYKSPDLSAVPTDEPPVAEAAFPLTAASS